MDAKDLHPEVARAFNAGDVDALVGLYEADGRLLHPDGTEARGLDAIREVLGRLRRPRRPARRHHPLRRRVRRYRPPEQPVDVRGRRDDRIVGDGRGRAPGRRRRLALRHRQPVRLAR
jgi:hypothetical protein